MNVTRVTNIGQLGETLAKEYLIKNGFKIIAQNFRKPYGEIDIIATRNNTLHFCEVKAVTCEIPSSSNGLISRVPDDLIPEENVHEKKLLRLGRVVQAYLAKLEEEKEWQFDVIAVFIDKKTKKALIRYTADVVLNPQKS